MTYDFFMGQLRLTAIGLIAYAAGKGWLSAADSSALVAIATPVGLLAGPWLWSLYSNSGMKLVPKESVAIAKTDTVGAVQVGSPVKVPADFVKVVGALFLGFILFAPHAAQAADFPIKAATVAAVPNCTPQNCSGWYAGASMIADGSNFNGGIIDSNVFTAGGSLMIDGGYQFWSGSWFAAFELGAGYEFTTNGTPQKGSRFTGMELIKLGYNFFPNATLSNSAPSQSPITLSVPANLLASTTPYLAFGGLQRRGLNVWTNGMGLETVIAAGWSSHAEYLYAPSQQGMAATQILRIGVDRHF